MLRKALGLSGAGQVIALQAPPLHAHLVSQRGVIRYSIRQESRGRTYMRSRRLWVFSVECFHSGLQ